MIGFSHKEQACNNGQRECKHDVADKTKFASLTFWRFIRQQIEDHCRPAGIAAPPPTEKQWAKDLCNEIMECGTSEDSGYDIELESLYLYILPANQAEEYQHIRTDQELGQFAAILPTCS